MHMQCPFCSPAVNTAQVALENTLCLFLQAQESILMGSGIIIPKQHRETVFDLTAEEWRATYDLLKDAKDLIDRQCAPDGYTVGWNCGQVGGQEVFHTHLHIIPRFKGEPLAGKGIRYWLKQDGVRAVYKLARSTARDDK